MVIESEFTPEDRIEFLDYVREYALQALVSDKPVDVILRGRINQSLAGIVQREKAKGGNFSRLTAEDVVRYYLEKHSADGFDGQLSDHLEVESVPDPEMGELYGDPKLQIRRKSG